MLALRNELPLVFSGEGSSGPSRKGRGMGGWLREREGREKEKKKVRSVCGGDGNREVFAHTKET